MNSRTLAVVIVATALFTQARTSSAGDDATLLRVFLKDGSALISYGEPAHVGDRVIFSMPTTSIPMGPSAPVPPLHLVDLPDDRVDWHRTSRYAESARATHYLESQAELDYAGLSNSLATTLNQVATSQNPSERLAIVESARKVLAEWPQNHFNYRQAEVRQMIGMLDDAIADLQAATGTNRIDLSFTAIEEVPPSREPLLPPPTLRESIEQVLAAARWVDSSAERTSLLGTALVVLDRNRQALPAAWVAATRIDVLSQIRVEQRTDAAYRTLTRGVMAAADRRVRLADVRGLERLVTRINQFDVALGGKRPEAVLSLLSAVQEKLDAARRLRLARDHWALRASVLAEYRQAINASMTRFAQLKPSLEAIKSLSGSSPVALDALERATTEILRATAAITPPEEVAGAHALLVSAAQLASNAAEIRRAAALTNDIDRAWNASSAAAGALMLGAKAWSDIQTVLRPPEFP